MKSPAASESQLTQALEPVGPLVDSHCHLSFPPLIDDLDGVLARAAAAGVGQIVLPAYDLASWPVVARLAEHAAVFPAFGLHPWQADQALDPSRLAAMLSRYQAVAIGEIGLDFKIASPDRRRQLEVLTSQLQLAVELDLPVILHCRGAFEELIAAVEPWLPHLTGVVHAYSRGPELAKRLAGLGFMLAFGGAITRPRARRVRRSAQVLPPDRILLETDAPSIGLDGVEPEQVEPSHILTIAHALAELRSESPELIARTTTENAHALFRL